MKDETESDTKGTRGSRPNQTCDKVHCIIAIRDGNLKVLNTISPS